jgi:hypothetical protein
LTKRFAAFLGEFEQTYGDFEEKWGTMRNCRVILKKIEQHCVELRKKLGPYCR